MVFMQIHTFVIQPLKSKNVTKLITKAWTMEVNGGDLTRLKSWDWESIVNLEIFGSKIQEQVHDLLL
jgi:hypothetical protein